MGRCGYNKSTPLPARLRVPEGEDITNKDKFFAENVDWFRVYGKKFNGAGPNNWSEIANNWGVSKSECIDPHFANDHVVEIKNSENWDGSRDPPKICTHRGLADTYNEEVCVKEWTNNNLQKCQDNKAEEINTHEFMTSEKCGCFEEAETYNGADISSALLTGLYAMENCSDGFKWGELADNFCAKPENFTASIGNGQCLDRNPGARKEYCKLKDNITKDTDNCSKAKLGEDDYNDVGIAYCKRDGATAEEGGKRQAWCKCYNLDTGVCETDLDAAGCRTARDGVEKNKRYFSAEEYDILRNNMVCRPGECSHGFLPKNYKDQCKPSYRICGQDVDIGLLSNSQLLVKCHSGEEDLPDFMRTGEQKGRSRYERNKNKRREPPFDQGLLSKTPIKSWPRRWSTDDEDAKYIVGYTVTSAASCLLVAGGLFMWMGKE